MTGRNGWNSMTHLPGSKTKLDSFGGGIELRAEFNVDWLAIIVHDIAAPGDRRWIHTRINRITGASHTATGGTLVAAAEQTLTALTGRTERSAR